MGRHENPDRPVTVVSYRDIFNGREVISEWNWSTAEWEDV